ncbi:nucleotidyltransferase family protein [Rubrivirga sp.]|uniref:nucleotidyltransferase family protein n=1 Tax=Rubrivirga sp. TaxID=1885344 RepID=UPI003B52AD7F
MALDLPEIRRRLADARPALARRYPIRSLAVFGSFARGEARPDSDVDVLVEFSGPIGWEIADLAEELDALLGRTVDLVPRGALDDRHFAAVEPDLVAI